RPRPGTARRRRSAQVVHSLVAWCEKVGAYIVTHPLAAANRFDSMQQFAERPLPDNVESLRVPPHSIEAEQAVLGGLMLSGQAWDRVADKLGEEDFYRREH